MAEMTNYLELATLDFWFNQVAFAKPAGLAISWHTTPGPDEDGSLINEVDIAGGGVGGRVAATFGDSSARQVSNNAQIDIASAAAAATITHVGLHRTDLTQQMLCYATLDTPLVIGLGDPVRYNTGGMIWDFPDTNSQGFSDYLVNAWLSHVFGVTDNSAAQPTNLYTGLHTGDPGATGAANEFTLADYARQLTAWDAAAVSGTDATASWVRNTSQLLWTNLNDSPISWWSAWDAATLGNFLARRNQTPDPIGAGANGTAAAQALSISCK